ncbi:hypothetical protein OSH11_24295 [Kaistia dalseonensis]|uniref:Na+(H+)/acetate symporter ActP n=1 Tax=Kaistia dalseonensis TaxID=410840 RepID=A0ABU0HG28_9HYPH|nr:hypothetical protein [Kaistia dalseonensis]MCX5497842.1 hypothetical protein [Kaistia dalseonensis]MDQ0440486.1 Na+(H+)/acetate symporter ActP [Kaistia dalseonensis]
MIALIVVLAGLAVVDALDQFGADTLVVSVFPVIPLAIALAIAFHLRGIGFGDIIRGGAIDSWAPGGALAGTSLSAVVLVGSPAAVALGGWYGLALIGALVAGLLLSSMLVMPELRATGSATLAEAIGTRFGRQARLLSVVAIVMAALPLIAAEATLGGTIAGRMLGLTPAFARDAIILLAAIACILGGLRAALGMAAVLAPIVALAFLLPVTIVAERQGLLPLPWTGLTDPAAFESAAAIPFSVVLALLASLVVGVAAMPSLLFPAWSTFKRPPHGRKLALGPLIVAAVLLAAPSYAVYGRLAAIDPTTNPAGLVLNFPERIGLSAAPSVLLIGSLLAAALIAMAMGLATLAASIGHDLYGGFVERTALEGRRVFIARLAMLLAAAAAIGVGRLPGANVAMLASVGLSVSAASLGPILLFGWRRRAVTSEAAIAAIAVGLWLTAANVVLATLAPDFSGRFLGMGVVAPTVLGPTGWFGLPVGLSGLIGLVCGLITLAAFTWLPRLNWPLLRLKFRWLARHFRRRVETALAERSRARAPKAVAKPASVAENPAPAPDAPRPDSTPRNNAHPAQPI